MRFYSYIANVALALALSASLFSAARAETILIMFEAEGCPYCDLWKAQIGQIYPKTEEAQIAPLLLMDINDPLPAGVTIDSDPIYTPTFVLINGGHEVARLVGYPGEDFFWGLLDRMLSKLPEQNTEGSS
jgi:hypothetical protein